MTQMKECTIPEVQRSSIVVHIIMITVCNCAGRLWGELLPYGGRKLHHRGVSCGEVNAQPGMLACSVSILFYNGGRWLGLCVGVACV